MPRIRIVDLTGRITGETRQNEGEALAHAFERAQIVRSYPCGGKGTCGKCRCRVMEGEAVITKEERLLLTEEELEVGERLLCRLTFLTDGTILLPVQEGNIESVGVSDCGAAGSVRTGQKYDAAVDIGTTTVALALCERNSGSVAASASRNNSQRSYGADVISRIEAANTGGAERLQQLIWQDITDGLDELLEEVGGGEIGRLVISANTTMEHLFTGDSCAGLGKYPFSPASLELRTKRAQDWYENVQKRYAKMEMTLLPGISAFVGADILAGMYECGLDQANRRVLFLDLGTNGEMVLKTGQGFLATATAAGPALEGAGISCGVAGVAGAVCGISLLGNRTVVQTIGKKPPIGLCGTGALELAYELWKLGIADEEGTFLPEYREKGFLFAESEEKAKLYFTQQDMRQLQMAKAAIRSGIEVLLEEAGIAARDLEKVFLAGGFGYALNVRKAAGIGLIPPVLRDRAVAVGNTSLLGALRFLHEPGDAVRLDELRRRTREINLAAHPAFESHYYRYLDFVESTGEGV